MFKKILVPLDLAESDLTKQAIEAALTLAEAPDAQLRFVNVQSLVPMAFMDYIPPTFEEEQRKAAEQELADTAAKTTFPGERITTRVRFGAITPEVLAEADEWGADLIVVCSHRPTMATYLIGSNAKSIVRHAKCSVLVVRR
ncbi:MAG: universal stress protein [Methylocystis sp.]|nr:universal stress protein [Methylocystis sp.]